MNAASKLVVVGSLNTDITLNVPHLPVPGETLCAQDANFFQGGKGANQAIAAARLGADVTMLGKVGMDAQSDDLIKSLNDAGVNTENILRDPSVSGGMAFITVDSDGRNMIVVWPAANGGFSKADLGPLEPAISGSDAIIAQFEIPLDTVEQSLRLARRHHVVTVCNPAPAAAVGRGFLELVDILIPNETEVSALTGMKVESVNDAMEAGSRVRTMGVERIAITLGDNGAVYVGPEGQWHCPAYPVSSVDTTGAGDAFVAAFTVAWLRCSDPWESLRYASAVGGLATTVAGAQLPASCAEDVMRLLRGDAISSTSETRK